ncbi:MAG: hypothetical protein DMF71_06190 [Acidobacteria bacterium]|nr:MAG: hypothetical protein DMF71_06190 [Acidobacteriota bacterium]
MAAPAEVTQISSLLESATTLGTIVDLVRRITHADTTSVVSFSLAEKTMTWEAASGFRAHVIDDGHPLIRPMTNRIAERALMIDEVRILESIGSPEFPAEDFPVHTAEGIRDLAVVLLKTRGQTLGALITGYRSPHQFTDDEKQLLQNLADMAAVAMDNARLLESVIAAHRIWEQTFDAIGEGIMVHDYQMQIVRCNARAAELMEMEPPQVIGLSFSEAFARLFGKRAAAYHLPETGGATSTFEVQTECGRRFLVSMFPIEQPDGESVNVVTWSDVTRLSEMQDQLARTRRLASVGQLAAGVAHEINNPLAAITTCAEATMRDMRENAEVQALADGRQWTYYLEEIVRQTLRCKDITRGLLDLTRQRQARRVICDVNAIARQCAKMGLQRAGESGKVEFVINLDEGIGQVATDAPMVRQILDNLLSNAVDALGEDGGKITVTTLRDGERSVIEVADTGQGIAPELLAKVFDPFFSTKGPGKGYGLGLPISLTLAESLGGALTVESKPGAGSRFRLWIPRRTPDS